MSRLGEGKVEIELGGERVVLSPSIEAAEAIGPILTVWDQVQLFDVKAYLLTIAAGSGFDAAQMRELRPAIFENMTKLREALTVYLATLLNGGRPPPQPANPEEAGSAPGEG